MGSEKSCGMNGRIAGVSLSSFLQMVEMDQQTCTVNVLTKTNLGQIFFYRGLIVDAGTMTLKQIAALYDILSWQDFTIEVEENTTKTHNVINLPLMHIIMEGARYADETRKKAPRPMEREPQDKILLKTADAGDFCLEIGIRLLIDLKDGNLTFKSTLVGIEHKKYLLIKAPAPFESFKSAETGELIIKALYKGTIYAFKSKLMAVISKPSRLAFIQYPETIEHHELRAHKRFRCSIDAQARMNEEEKNGIIENISMGGCRCTIEPGSGKKTVPAPLLNQTLVFKCRFPGTGKDIRFKARVRNFHTKAQEISVGVEFMRTDDADEAKKIIKDYIRLIEYAGQDV